ncbi:sigma-70 family RNA polymerase sigma factor [Adhaeretor mobilis]|uniref:sigma-70 family RNA polymerase sigma factor n=1 Tax=Adhaeretor mobilis TaxID=1930276 RepID=UPI001C54E0BE|nr:sigma-70 family RNA polymerase sigma factor [Adhaeretor mobilis]
MLAASERRLAGFVLAIVPNFADADELLQETKIRLWEQFEDYDPSKSFDAWAKSIAYFQVLTYRKKKGREKVVFSTELINSLEASYANHEKEMEVRFEALQECLKLLSEKYQTLLGKLYSSSMSVAQVAKSLEMSAEGTRKALYRSRKALHSCIHRRLQSEDRI